MEIFIDQESVSYLELGSWQYPYKSIVPALCELFNFLPVKDFEFSILVKEGTRYYFEHCSNRCWYWILSILLLGIYHIRLLKIDLILNLMQLMNPEKQLQLPDLSSHIVYLMWPSNWRLGKLLIMIQCLSVEELKFNLFEVLLLSEIWLTWHWNLLLLHYIKKCF